MDGASGNRYIEENLLPLAGGTITGINIDNSPATLADFGEPVYGLSISRKDGQRIVLWFMSDAEGNGPGFPEVENAR